MYKIGFIINPIAGMGGRVGLKGTDGADTLARATELGATPQAHLRAGEALAKLNSFAPEIRLFTPPGIMGEMAAREAGFEPNVIGTIDLNNTTSRDTTSFAKQMLEKEIDLLLFAGGDGTARDICSAIERDVPALGIPAGVKIHSAVFAANPAKAGELAVSFLKNSQRRTVEAEVMDIHEEDYRRGILNARLYGYMSIPQSRSLLQGGKRGSPTTDTYDQEAISQSIVEMMEPDTCYIIGPGTTTRAIMEKLELENSLLGIDLVKNGKLLGKDLREDQLLELIAGKKIKLIVTPVGGQGFLLGRGNQQISPKVLKKVGKENIIIVATQRKINSLFAKPLLIDSGDPQLDVALSDYYTIITGYKQQIIYKVAH